MLYIVLYITIIPGGLLTNNLTLLFAFFHYCYYCRCQSNIIGNIIGGKVGVDLESVLFVLCNVHSVQLFAEGEVAHLMRRRTKGDLYFGEGHVYCVRYLDVVGVMRRWCRGDMGWR